MKKKFRFCCKILHGFDFFMSLNSDLYIVPNIKILKVILKLKKSYYSRTGKYILTFNHCDFRMVYL